MEGGTSSNQMMDTKEFNNLIIPIQDKLFRFALSLLKDTIEAEDVLQDTLTRLWEQRNELCKCRSVEAFSMIMVKNKCIDRLRKKNYTQPITNNFIKPGNNNLQHQVEVSDSARWVQQMIDNLPPVQQIVIRLRDVEGYELKEIAEIAEITEGAVRANLSRARQTVREQLIKWHGYENR